MKPILFNTEMVRAILDGRKTCTRRVVKPHYRDDEAGFQVISNAHTGKFVRVEKVDENECGIFADGTERIVSPPYQPGDVLWVRETWAEINGEYFFRADDESPEGWYLTRWHPSIHMPREAARIFLRVTSARVERLQEITAADIDAEGCKEYAYSAKTGELLPSSPIWFKIVWDGTIKKANLDKYGWSANPWVWVIEFERIIKNEALRKEAAHD